MASEFDALHRQHTWSLVPPCADQNIIGCRWVYKIKRNTDGSISRYKARLVAKGFHQQAGVDFDETFSPVVKPPTVRIILSLAAQNQWTLRQLAVSNAFLHGLLKECVFMAQPIGFLDSAHPSHVCQLHKSLYGLKQAPRAWFERFTSHLLTLGFSASVADATLFVLHHGSTTVYLLLYVDDIIITGNNPTAVSDIITQLSTAFELKDLGPLRYFLGLQIEYKKVGLFVHQHKYLTDFLHKFHMTECKAATTPIAPTPSLSTTTTDLLSDPTPYRSLVGALQYATFTRPDIAFAVNRVCQFMHQPSTLHFAAAKRILRYLKGTLDKGVLFQPGPLALTAFTDADWAGDASDRRSTSGIVVFLGNNPITWLSKKQHTVSRSSTEAEYRSLATDVAELAWLRQVLCDLRLYLPSAPLIWCDNTSALALASNPVFHGRTKHIEVDYHYVREKVVRGDLSLQFISTHDQLADIFTKALPSTQFLLLCSKLLVQFHLGVLDLDIALHEFKKSPIPTDTSSAEENDLYKAWEKSNRLSIMFMRMTIAKNIKTTLPKIDDAKEFLANVVERFKTADKSLVGTLMAKLTTMKFNGTHGIQEHVLEMTNLAAQLKTLGMNVDEFFLMQFILNSLPPQYGPFQINYNTMKDKWNLNQLANMLNQEEARLKQFEQHSVHLGFLSIQTISPNENFMLMGNQDTRKLVASGSSRPKANLRAILNDLKLRLVAKGFTQKRGIDYKETFSPVSKNDSLRIIMALVAHYDLELHQMDVKTAFLNGSLEEEVYMDQPKGFSIEGKEHLACKLKKSIYRLKQASRQWYLKFNDTCDAPKSDKCMCAESHIGHILGQTGLY
uniref:Reverse transcriptase Ty1/copia-type domain-containing protein n=1 Tax=Fagus sylvatica TaxID=28930 RepID=A0A2N9JB37_FAGSY